MPPSTRVYTVEQYSFACIGESANVTRCRRIRFSRRVSGATIANGDVVDKQAIRYRIFGTSTGIINCNLCGTISNAQKVDRQHTAAPTAGRFYDILVGTCNGAINAALTYLNTFDRTVRRKSQYAGIGDSFSNRNLYTAITRLCLIPRVFINPYWIFCAAGAVTTLPAAIVDTGSIPSTIIRTNKKATNLFFITSDLLLFIVLLFASCSENYLC